MKGVLFFFFMLRGKIECYFAIQPIVRIAYIITYLAYYSKSVFLTNPFNRIVIYYAI
jgi:hypothetical protein